MEGFELATYDSDEDVAGNEAQLKKDVAIESTSFKDFLLKPELMKAIEDCGFVHPSDVQSRCIPFAVLGCDLICQAKSGMGKTAIYILSVLQQLSDLEYQATQDKSKEKARCLVLCHRRELAYSICHQFNCFKKYMPWIRAAVFFGGMSVSEHQKQLQEDVPHIVVGTPGRVLQLATEGALDLSQVRHFVLDECDKMLESIEMRRDVQNIFKLTPHNKQVLMFSAKLSEEIRPICRKFTQQPMEVYMNEGSQNDTKITALGKFVNKIVVVTGGTGNVGSGIVKGFIKQGATVIVPSRNEESLQWLSKFVHPHEAKLVPIREAIGTEEGATNLKKFVEEKFGRIDHFVSSIGAGWFNGPLSKQGLGEFNKVIGDLATSHFLVGKAFLPWMSQQEGSTYTIITGAAGEGISDPRSSLMTVGASTLFGISLAFRKEFEKSPLLLNEYRIVVRVVKPEDVHQPWENSNEVFAEEFLRTVGDVIEHKRTGEVIRLTNLPK